MKEYILTLRSFFLAVPVLKLKFLHAGFIHYTMNMIALWIIGYAVEQSHGFFATALLFVLSGLGGNLMSALFLAQFLSVGASGCK